MNGSEKKMKVLFIGGTGLISLAVSKMAVRQGFELYMINRGRRSQFVPESATVLQGDINNADEVQALIKGHHFDSVVNWIVFKPEEIERDIKLFTGKTNQYIFISTVATFQKPPAYYVINESSTQYNPLWEYAQDKIACEERLIKEYRDNKFPMTIARPSNTYGITSIPFAITSGAHMWTIVDRILKGKKIIVPGDGTSLWSITHNTDFGKGLIGLLGNNQAIGHSFNITSDEVKTWDQYLKDIGQAVGIEPRIIHITSECISMFMPELRAGLLTEGCNSFIVDNSKLKRFVPGYMATTSFEHGIRQTIAYYNEHPEMKTIDDEFNAKMDKTIAAYEKFLSSISNM